MMKTKLFTLLALALCAGALFCVPAYASAEPAATAEPVAVTSAETLTVNAVWLEGDTLHIEVADKATGAEQSLTLNLKDYAGVNDEFVTVQAIDRAGNKSNTIQFKNPFYQAPAKTPVSPAPAEPSASPGQSESGVPSGGFTPDGAGTVLDNAVNGEGKEFFTIQAEDGAVFYLIVDRERTQDNVYFLSAVTENDLLSLAKPGDGTSESGIPTNPTPPQTVTPTPEPSAEPTPTPANNGGGMNTGALVFVVIAALAAGGAGYYFKILRPKKQGTAEPEEDYGEPDDDFNDADDDYGDAEDDEEGDSE